MLGGRRFALLCASLRVETLALTPLDPALTGVVTFVAARKRRGADATELVSVASGLQRRSFPPGKGAVSGQRCRAVKAIRLAVEIADLHDRLARERRRQERERRATSDNEPAPQT